MTKPLFDPGWTVATSGALDALERCDGVSVSSLLRRYLRGDWGDLDAADKATNDNAVKNGDRILSSYTLATGDTIWITTEADRSVTTLLLPVVD